MEHSKSQTGLMAKDAELERKNVEIGSLQADKAGLDKLVQEKQSEIGELRTRLAAAADRSVALTQANAQLDAQLHEAQAAASRTALTLSRLQQEKEIQAKSNAWLSQELDRKSEAFNAERRKATDTILDLQRRLAEAESTAQRLQAEHGRLAEKLEAQRAAAEVREWACGNGEEGAVGMAAARCSGEAAPRAPPQSAPAPTCPPAGGVGQAARGARGGCCAHGAVREGGGHVAAHGAAVP